MADYPQPSSLACHEYRPIACRLVTQSRVNAMVLGSGVGARLRTMMMAFAVHRQRGLLPISRVRN